MPQELTCIARPPTSAQDSLLRPANGSTGPVGAAAVSCIRKTKLDVPGASGIVALGEGRFAVVDDDKGLFEVDETAGTRVLATKDHKLLKDLEGLCRAAEPGSLYALSERTGRVLSVTLTPGGGIDGAVPPAVLGVLPDIHTGRNKGWEGLDFLPGACCPDGMDRLVAVHEGFPRRVGFFPVSDLETGQILPLPDEVDQEALDLSDVAVDQGTGHLFVVSDESGTLLEFRLVSDGHIQGLKQAWLETVSVHTLDLSRKEKPEALDFGPDGTLWLATDRKARLYELQVSRR